MPETLCGFNDVPGGATGAQLLVTYGPTLYVDIGFDTAHATKSTKPPIAGMKGIGALVDTGAQQSCIDSLLAKQLNLPVVNKAKICGVNGTFDVNIHLAQVYIPTLNFVIYGMFAGVHLAAGGQMHKALIGRSFLQNYSMVYDGKTGTVKISN